jgi:tartrate-resistant acid phosphatase type 5
MAALAAVSIATCLLVPVGDRKGRDRWRISSVDGAAQQAPVCPASAPAPEGDRLATRFAAIGDYGIDSPGEQAVAVLVKGWAPDFVVTLGDNNYPYGAAETIDTNIGKYFHELIGGYLGHYGCGAAANRFFPALGNHDLRTEAGRPYLDYFQLPGNERYYDFVRGDVHLFAIDSDPSEPDGTGAGSIQAAWLKAKLAASTARWQVVYMHHPPHSSGPHGSTPALQWPYAAWGADLVLTGHDHHYERIRADGITYVVNGLGGADNYPIGSPVAGSVARFTGGFGALLIDADGHRLRARFTGAAGNVIDEFQLD